jgi:hypothetical protein
VIGSEPVLLVANSFYSPPVILSKKGGVPSWTEIASVDWFQVISSCPVCADSSAGGAVKQQNIEHRIPIGLQPDTERQLINSSIHQFIIFQLIDFPANQLILSGRHQLSAEISINHFL